MTDPRAAGPRKAVNFSDAVMQLSREERSRATIYAMHYLLIEKGVYTQEEFNQLFTQWAEKHLSKSKPEKQGIFKRIWNFFSPGVPPEGESAQLDERTNVQVLTRESVEAALAAGSPSGYTTRVTSPSATQQTERMENTGSFSIDPAQANPPDHLR